MTGKSRTSMIRNCSKSFGKRKKTFAGTTRQDKQITDLVGETPGTSTDSSSRNGGVIAPTAVDEGGLNPGDIPSTSASTSVSTPASASTSDKSTKIFKTLTNKSQEKLKNTSFSLLEASPTKRQKTRSASMKLGLTKRKHKKVYPLTGYQVVDMSLLHASLASFAVCGVCKKKNTIQLLTDTSKPRYGLAEYFILKCKRCSHEKICCTSKKTVQKGRKSRRTSFYDVNIRSVLASQSMGQTQLGQFCATMDLPPPVTTSAYIKMQKKLCADASLQAESIMKDAAKRLFDVTRKDNPHNIVSTKFGDLAHVSVTVDGTWQRRGHCSKHGVVFVLSVETGEVLDFVVKSLVCHECTSHNNDNKASKEYLSWKEKHKAHCCINHEGSAASMENQGAIEIFERSIETRNLIYSTYVGDGDSGSFAGVKDACFEKYGELYTITKEECVGHIQKRIGSGLREYKRKKKGIKLSDGKGVAGAGRLTDLVIDKIQNNYGEAIRNNVGDKKSMKKDIWAIFKHRIINDKESLERQHDFCPRDRWCKFWNNPEDYTNSGRLPSVFVDELKPLFTRLSEDELLNRCMRGLTQNQNEAINQILWSKCPKTKFCGQQKIRLAVCETVGHFNTGSASRAVLLKSGGVVPSSNMLSALRKADTVRVQKAARKVTVKCRLHRRKLRAKRKNKAKDKVTYMAGGFGLGATPEDVTGMKEKKKRKRASEDENTRKKKKGTQKTKTKDKETNDVNFISEPVELQNQSDDIAITFINDNDIPCFKSGSK